ncbi:MAG: cytochrome c [Gammaproteobacteria bacterium]|nr:cytochrome c [Gammaproteobacteria bacterium]
MKKVLMLICALCVVASGTFFVANAQEEMTPEELAASAVSFRKALFRTIYFNLRPIGAMAQGAPFDAEVAQRNANRIAVIASMIPEVFAENTSEFSMIETTALPTIWENMEDFESKAQALIDNANAFSEAASTGDFNQAMGAFRAFGGSCGNCHDTYRVDEDE